MALPPRDEKGRFTKPLMELLGPRGEDEKNTDAIVNAVEASAAKITSAVDEGSDGAGKEQRQEEKKDRKGLFKSLSSTILGGMGEIGKNIGKIGKKGGGLVESLLGSIGLGIPALGMLGAGLTGLGLSITGDLFPKIKPIVSALKLLAYSVFGPVIAIIDFAVGFFKGFANSEESNFGAKLVDGLVGGVAQIVDTLTFGLIGFDAIKDFLDPIYQPFKDAFYNISAIINDPDKGIFGKIMGVIGEIFLAIGRFQLNIITKIGEVIANVGSYILFDLGPMLFEKLKEGFNFLFDFFTIELPAYLPVIYETVKNAVLEVGNTLYNFFFETVPNFIMELPGMIGNAVLRVGTYLLDVFQYPITVLGEWFTSAKLSIQILMAKAAKYIAEVLNVFGADEDDPAVIAAQKKIDQFEREKAQLDAVVAERKAMEAKEEAKQANERFERLARRGQDKALGAYVRGMDRDEQRLFMEARAAKTGQSIQEVQKEIMFAEQDRYTSGMERQTQINQINTTNAPTTNAMEMNPEPSTDIEGRALVGSAQLSV